MKAYVSLIGFEDKTNFFINIDNEEQLDLLDKMAFAASNQSRCELMPVIEYFIVEDEEVTDKHLSELKEYDTISYFSYNDLLKKAKYRFTHYKY